MVPVRRSPVMLIVVAGLLLPLASCANSGLGQTLQNSLAADPKLKSAAPDGTLQTLNGDSSPSASPSPIASPTPVPNVSPDNVPPDNVSPDISAIPAPSPAPTTSQTPVDAPTASPSATPSPAASPPIRFPGGEVFLGLSGNVDGTSGTANNSTTGAVDAASPAIATTPNSFTDVDKSPKELKPYVADLAQLGVLNLTADGKAKSNGMETFSPNKPVSRREYARWLFAANNRLFSDRAAQQIRPAQSSAQPAFRDVPPTDPDFAAIQGLAEAGIIPSALSSDPTAITFRADAQLSRETLLLWKVPMDTRQPLPTATLEAVKQAWGFQDAARIAPTAQRAVLADYQNGDLANIRRAFGFTTLFQPKKAVTRAEAAATLWYFGYQGDGRSAQETLSGTVKPKG